MSTQAVLDSVLWYVSDLDPGLLFVILFAIAMTFAYTCFPVPGPKAPPKFIGGLDVADRVHTLLREQNREQEQEILTRVGRSR